MRVCIIEKKDIEQAIKVMEAYILTNADKGVLDLDEYEKTAEAISTFKLAIGETQ